MYDGKSNKYKEIWEYEYIIGMVVLNICHIVGNFGEH